MYVHVRRSTRPEPSQNSLLSKARCPLVVHLDSSHARCAHEGVPHTNEFKSMYECRYLVAHLDVALLVQCIDPLNQSVFSVPWSSIWIHYTRAARMRVCR